MSWSSRFPSLGRWSPFTRSPPPPGPYTAAEATVRDGDYSYITSSDLAKLRTVAPTDGRETDVVHLRLSPGSTFPASATSSTAAAPGFPVHFATHSIDAGDLTVADLRGAAARKLGVADARGLRLTYRGRALRDDARMLREEGLRSGAEVLCGHDNPHRNGADGVGGGDEAGEDEAEGDDGEDDSEDGDAGREAGSRRKRRGGGRRKKKSSRRSKGGHQASSDNSPAPPAAPSLAPPPPASGAGAAPSSGASTPTTPLGQLDALAAKLATELRPACEAYMRAPPADPAKRDFEHKRLSETLLAQILLKLDAVETAGDATARARRKEVVRDTQEVLGRLDAMKGR